MAQPFLHEFKKQASFFLKEKIKTARLALTDVTPTQILTEEATNGNPSAPDTKTLKMISKAAFEVDDYWRIVGILHKKLSSFDRKNWRISYKAVIVLEHLLTHGPESVAEEFQGDKDVIREMGSFQLIDERGFNWGLNVRKKSERILKLLEDVQLLKEERNKSRKISRGFEGFGSFNIRTSILEESTIKPYGRSNSQFNHHENDDDYLNPCISSKENMHKWNFNGESKALLDEHKEEPRMGFSVEEDHPFRETDRLTRVSLLSSGDQACQYNMYVQ